MWWPALAMICVAGWPGSGLGTVAGVGVGLVVLGLVDFGLHRSGPVRSKAAALIRSAALRRRRVAWRAGHRVPPPRRAAEP